MRVISHRTLLNYADKQKGRKAHGALKSALDAWYAEVKKVKWRNSSDVKRLYATASVVSADRIVFNIKGNDYRLIVAVDFEKAIVWIKWIGTHREYDEIDARDIQHE